MKSNVAAFVPSISCGNGDCDLGGTSALGVVHSCSALAARLLLLANGSIGHFVVELQLNVKLN